MSVVRVGAEELRRGLAHLLSQVRYGEDHVIVERHREPVAVLIPYAEYERWQMGERPQTVAFAESGQVYADFEQAPRLAAKITAALIEAGVSLEEMMEGMQEQRMRTLRELYPEFLARHEQEDVA